MKPKRLRSSQTVSESEGSVFGNHSHMETNSCTSVFVDGGTSVSAFGATLDVDPGRASTLRTPVNLKFEFTDHHRKLLIGFFLMLLGASFWVGATECAEKTYDVETFKSPFFVFYFSSAWIIVFYPVFLSAQFASNKGKISLKETFRENIKIFMDEELTHRPLKILGKFVLFCVLWGLANYVYIRALSFKGPMDVTALFATNPSFVYLMSWIILQKRFIAVRIVAFIVAMTGIIMITYMEAGFASEEMWGSVFAMVATAAAAAYRVLFKRIFGDVSNGQLCIFISCLGIFHLLTMLPIFLLLYLTKAEPIEWTDVPWIWICTAAACALAFNFLLHFGKLVTYRLMVQGSFLAAIPVCAVTELIVNSDFTAEPMQIGAYVLISISYLLNSLPEDWQEKLMKAMKVKPPRRRTDDAHMTPRQRLRSSTAGSSH